MTQLITEQQAVGIATALEEWSALPEEKTLGDLLAAIRRYVAQIVRHGFSYEEIAEALNKHQIAVTTEIVTSYFAPSRQGKGTQKRQVSQSELRQVIAAEVFENAVVAIKELSQEKRGMTRKEFVQQNLEVLELCLAAGKGYPKISEFLEAQQGIKIAPKTLAKYHHQAKKTGKSAAPPKSASQAVADKEATSSAPQAVTSVAKRLPEEDVELSEFNL